MKHEFLMKLLIYSLTQDSLQAWISVTLSFPAPYHFQQEPLLGAIYISPYNVPPTFDTYQRCVERHTNARSVNAALISVAIGKVFGMACT